mgnify:CR=1 FL=1
MLDIQHLTKTYGEKKAVDDLSLRIAPGEIYGFIGHNGAGKTTTLKAAVGILQFDAGDIFIGGKSIRTDPLGCKRQLAYIPDNPDLYDLMRGIPDLNVIAGMIGIPAAARWARTCVRCAVRAAGVPALPAVRGADAVRGDVLLAVPCAETPRPAVRGRAEAPRKGRAGRAARLLVWVAREGWRPAPPCGVLWVAMAVIMSFRLQARGGLT